MSEWGAREVAKGDATRRFWIGAALMLSFGAFMVGGTILVLKVFDLRRMLLLHTLVTTALMLSLPVLWAVIVRELRRKQIAAASGADLSGAFAVEVSVLVQEEAIGQDVGFLVFREGSFAFLGLRSRFAYRCDQTDILPSSANVYNLRTTVTHGQGTSRFLFVPNDRLMFKTGKVRAIERAFAEHKRLAPPTGWRDVLPPSGIDPTIEVTEKDVRKFDRIWIAYVLLVSLPLISIALNLWRGKGAFDDFTFHTVIGPVSVWWHTHTERKKVYGRYVVHEAVRREGHASLQDKSKD